MNSSSEMKESTSGKKSELHNGEKDAFPKHIITIQGESLLYKCTVCDKTFKTKSNCCYHKHCADDSEKPYTCSTCNRKFSSKTHFDYHSLMHTGVNPFKCDQCDKSFKTRNKLLRHKEVHSDKRKLYKCDLCDRSFLRKTSIKVHRKSHTGEKPYSCPHCSKAFSEKKKLINHISSHTGIKDWICEVCGKSYSIKWNLELHKRTHSKTRPYYCEKCQQSFSQNRYLKRHMETHKNSVKYLCNLCDKEFSRKDNLQRHIVNTHLEYANPTAVKVEKIAKSYITKVVANDEEPIPAEPQPPPAPLNEEPKLAEPQSVIKSLTKTREIIDYQYQDLQPQFERISVIKTIGKSSRENQDVIEPPTPTIEEPPQQQQVPEPPLQLVPECQQIANEEPHQLSQCQEIANFEPDLSQFQQLANMEPQLADPVLDQIAYDLSSKDPTPVTNRSADYCDFAHDDFASYSSSKEMMKSPRCFLPKKLITASYKERSTYSGRNSFTATKSVIMNIDKY
ncbi:zinc finger protein 271-like [Planococcus citri]|uniref:zinc finger protein 271-like n=1 Tax=Planococcus citri TaxID=170843 RepID=UPI0031F7A8F4